MLFWLLVFAEMSEVFHECLPLYASWSFPLAALSMFICYIVLAF
jgi:hypothetical protein